MVFSCCLGIRIGGGLFRCGLAWLPISDDNYACNDGNNVSTDLIDCR